MEINAKIGRLFNEGLLRVMRIKGKDRKLYQRWKAIDEALTKARKDLHNFHKANKDAADKLNETDKAILKSKVAEEKAKDSIAKAEILIQQSKGAEDA